MPNSGPGARIGAQGGSSAANQNPNDTSAAGKQDPSFAMSMPDSVTEAQSQMIRLNLPLVDLNTIIFERDRPFFYLINETHVEKYSYHLNVAAP